MDEYIYQRSEKQTPHAPITLEIYEDDIYSRGSYGERWEVFSIREIEAGGWIGNDYYDPLRSHRCTAGLLYNYVRVFSIR